MSILIENISSHLPSGWQVVLLGKILTEVDSRYKYSRVIGSDLPVLSLTRSFGLILQSERFYKRVATEDVSKYKVVNRGEIVYNPYVIWEGAVHSLKKFDQGLVSPAYLVWKCNNEQSNEFLIDTLLRTPMVIEQYNLFSAGAVNRRRAIKKEDFLKIKIPFPSLPEQRRIAYVLATVQTVIEQQRRLITLTRELKSALMRKLFTEGLRGEKQNETEIGLMPKSWDEVCVRDMGEVITGRTPSTKHPEYYDGEYKLISPADLDAEKYVRSAHRTLTRAGFEQCRGLPKETVLVGCIGNIGKIGMTPDDMCATNQQINSIICDKLFNPHFVYYCLQFNRTRLENIAAKVTLPIVNKSNFEDFKIASPKKNQQDEIAEVLTVLDDKFEILEKKKQKLEELFRTLLHQLMTGQIRVDELEI